MKHVKRNIALAFGCRMFANPAPLFVFACVLLSATSAHAQEPGSTSNCTASRLSSPERYERLHQIPTTAAHEDVTHKVITPGGMVLSTPNMVAATDVLTIVARDESALCFELLTLGRERDECAISGQARSEGRGTFVFRERDTAVRFTFSNDDQVSVEPIGNGYREHCESAGEIQSAMYKRNASSG